MLLSYFRVHSAFMDEILFFGDTICWYITLLRPNSNFFIYLIIRCNTPWTQDSFHEISWKLPQGLMQYNVALQLANISCASTLYNSTSGWPATNAILLHSDSYNNIISWAINSSWIFCMTHITEELSGNCEYIANAFPSATPLQALLAVEITPKI